MDENLAIMNRYLRNKYIFTIDCQDMEYAQSILNEKTKEFYHLERPDIALYNPNTDKIYGLEHFSFSSYTENKKGSVLARKEAKFNRDHKKKVEDNLNQTLVSTNHRFQVKSHIKEYYHSFVKNFENHVRKVDDYKNAIKKEFGTDVDPEIGFMIEDTSTLGTYRGDVKIANGKLKVLYPYEVSEIYELLTASPVDFYIFTFSAQDENQASLFITKQQLLNNAYIKKNLKSYHDIKLLPIEPKVVAWSYKVSGK